MQVRNYPRGITLCLCSNVRTHGHYTFLLICPPSRPVVSIQKDLELHPSFSTAFLASIFSTSGFGKPVSPFIPIALPFLGWLDILTQVYD